MTLAPLRPDLLLIPESPPRLLIIEVKQTETETSKPERRGLVEAMAYIHDAASILHQRPEPNALVVGWNASATPGFDSVVDTDQDHTLTAIELILDAWSRGSSE